VDGRNGIDLLTNLTFDVDEFVKNVKPEQFSSPKNPAYKSIRVSFHPERMDPNDLIDKVSSLQDKRYNIGVFGINHPNHVEDNIAFAELARRNQVYFFVKDFLGEFNGQSYGTYKYPNAVAGGKQTKHCRISELLVDPSGEVYRCHRDLYHQEGTLGSLLDPEFKIDDRFRPCHNYGECNPCDVKLKTNRFLQMGKCSVEIL